MVFPIVPASGLCRGSAGSQYYWMQLFCLQLEASCLQWSFLYLQLTIVAFLLTVGAFLLTALASLLTVGAFLPTMGKARLIRALRDCKQRSSTVSKKAPTVSKKASPLDFWVPQDRRVKILAKGPPFTGEPMGPFTGEPMGP